MLNNIAGLLGGGTPPDLGAYNPIATVTVGAGGAASVSFTSIPSTYKHLQIRGIGRSDWAGQVSTNLFYKLNSDSTAANYTYHILRGDGASASAAGGTSLNLLANDTLTASNAPASDFGAIVADFLDYTNTSKYKTSRALSGDDRNGAGQVALDSSLWLNTAAITQIDLYPQNGNFVQYSTFALYGITG